MSDSKRILVLCPQPENTAPGQRLKYEQYFGYLREKGYAITVSSYQTRPLWSIVYKKGYFFRKVFWVLVGYGIRVRDLFRIPFFDGVYIFLRVTPFGPPIFERLVKLLAKKVVYDIDDLVFMNKTSDANRVIGFLKGSAKYFYLMKHADHVITCTPYLDGFVRKYNTNTTDISSTIDTEKYIPKSRYANDHRLVLGWSGSFSTSPYLRLLAEPLRELRKRVDFKLRVIGDPSFTMEGIEVEALPWVESTEVRDLSPIDIGLYPLPDEQWVLGKSGLKALQYMALGIPTVATALGANFRVIEDKISGFLVTTPSEWIARLEQLASDPKLRQSIGERARERVENRFSIHSNRDTYLQIFQRTYDHGRK